MDFDDSTNTVFHTISQFNNSDIDTPGKFQNSEPSPFAFSQPPFRPLYTPTCDETSPAFSSYTDANPILSLMTSHQPDPSSPVDEELEYELDNFIIVQQQLQNTITLKILHLTQSISSESSDPASIVKETRAHRVIKRKHPNT